MALSNSERQARYKQRLKEAAGLIEPEDLRMVREVFSNAVPGCRCEIWDYEFRFRCGALDARDDTQSVTFLRRGVTREQAEVYAEELRAKLG